jgi:hypothetical protein
MLKLGALPLLMLTAAVLAAPGKAHASLAPQGAAFTKEHVGAQTAPPGERVGIILQKNAKPRKPPPPRHGR